MDEQVRYAVSIHYIDGSGEVFDDVTCSPRPYVNDEGQRLAIIRKNGVTTVLNWSQIRKFSWYEVEHEG